MATIYDLKPKFQTLLRPIAGFLFRAGIKPNWVTFITMLLSVAVGWFLWLNQGRIEVFFVLPVFLFIRMALNAIDGIMAVEHNMQTKLGVFLNEIGDVVSDSALYLPFAFIPGISFWMIILAVFLSILSEFAGLVAVLAGGSRAYHGPMGKSDRAFAFSILALFLAFGFEPGIITTGFIWIVIAMTFVTIINRTRGSLA